MCLLPLVCNSLFPQKKSAIGSAATYLFNVMFFLIASLQNRIFGGKEGLRKNMRFILFWPAVIGFIRLILIAIFLLRFETPRYWLDNFRGSMDELKIKLDKVHMLIYEEKSALVLTKNRITESVKFKTQGEKTGNFFEIFSLKYRKRTFLGIVINLCQQLGGINIMAFFSTQIFDEISGNGPLITLLMSLSNVLGAISSIFLAGLPRIRTFSTALFFHAVGILGVAAGI